jgi:hypothetical protein
MQGPARAGGVGVDLETGLVWPGMHAWAPISEFRGFGGRRATSCLIGLLDEFVGGTRFTASLFACAGNGIGMFSGS